MKSILILDDDHDVADTLGFIAKRRGYAVTIAYDAESALDLAKTKSFDIAFLDMLLPGMNGAECLVKLRKTQPQLKAFMMTGFAGGDLIRAAYDGGAIDVLRKPVMPEDILQRLARFDQQALLIVDDDADFAFTTGNYLKRTGWTTKQAANGETALKMLKSESFAAVLLDLNMPSVSGLEVLAAMRAEGLTVPTIVITGISGGADSVKDMNAHGCLRKPVDPRDLLRLIEQVADKSKAA
jgi:two-component system, NtrC family, response regulator HydG